MPKRKSRTTEYLKLDCPFIGVPDDTVCSPELNSLSVHSRWLYMVILTKFNRLKDRIKDEYKFTYKEMGEIAGFDNRRLAFCVDELEVAKFLYVVHGGKNNPSLYTPVIEWLV